MDELTISLMGGIIAALMALYTILTGLLVRRREKRARASDLFTEFYTGEFYRFAVLPVYRLTVKVRGLPPEEQRDYLEAVACGWVGASDPRCDLDHFIPPEEQALDPSRAHFRLQHTTEAHTEHDSLTIFLYFWVRVDRLIEAGLVDRDLFAELFRNSFRYYETFMDDLARVIQARCQGGDVPSWLPAVQRIEHTLRVEPA